MNISGKIDISYKYSDYFLLSNQIVSYTHATMMELSPEGKRRRKKLSCFLSKRPEVLRSDDVTPWWPSDVPVQSSCVITKKVKIFFVSVFCLCVQTRGWLTS
jgi:hypothetical protein